MHKANNIKEVNLDGHHLSLNELVGVAKYNAKVLISEETKNKIIESRKLVEKIVEENQIAYGITTGFGDLAKVVVDKESSNQLSTNLVLSHAVATGNPYKIDQVRAMMLLLCNSLAHGYSGCRLEIIEILIEMLNKNVTPYVPEKGSLGASGDLAPLSHIALLVLGKGKAYYQDELLDGKTAMAKANIKTVDTLVNKEGLALTNGTHAMTAVAALNLYDALKIEVLANTIAAMSFSALQGQLNAYDKRIHELRGQDGQIKVANNILELTKDSLMVKNGQGKRVQDAYSLRCIPQVHGACKDSIEYVKTIIEKEMNAVTDNPLLFIEDEAVISGGNFHGEPIALAMDFLGIAISELASISERRLERMVNQNLSNGLYPFLTSNPGINSGYMIVQYSAASMVSENKVLAHPASVDSIPSSANQEDFVSMGSTATRKCSWIIQNTLSVLAYELLTACQGVDIRNILDGTNNSLSKTLQKVYERVRKDIDYMQVDKELRIDIEKIEEIIRSDDIVDIVLTQLTNYQ